MTTSAHKPTTGPAFSARARQVAVSDDYLGIQLEDGRRLEVPLAWFPRLAQASAEQRKNWRLIGRGVGIHWPDLDEDVSVENLLAAPGEILSIDLPSRESSYGESGVRAQKLITWRNWGKLDPLLSATLAGEPLTPEQARRLKRLLVGFQKLLDDEELLPQDLPKPEQTSSEKAPDQQDEATA